MAVAQIARRYLKYRVSSSWVRGMIVALLNGMPVIQTCSQGYAAINKGELCAEGDSCDTIL